MASSNQEVGYRESIGVRRQADWVEVQAQFLADDRLGGVSIDIRGNVIPWKDDFVIVEGPAAEVVHETQFQLGI